MGVVKGRDGTSEGLSPVMMLCMIVAGDLLLQPCTVSVFNCDSGMDKFYSGMSLLIKSIFKNHYTV